MIERGEDFYINQWKKSEVTEEFLLPYFKFLGLFFLVEIHVCWNSSKKWIPYMYRFCTEDTCILWCFGSVNYIEILIKFVDHHKVTHSQYILWATSPPMRWNCVRREKDWHLGFTLFFPLTCWEDSKFFYQIGSFLSKNNQNLQNVSDKNKKLTPEVFLYFSFLNSVGIRRPKNKLRMA